MTRIPRDNGTVTGRMRADGGMVQRSDLDDVIDRGGVLSDQQAQRFVDVLSEGPIQNVDIETSPEWTWEGRPVVFGAEERTIFRRLTVTMEDFEAMMTPMSEGLLNDLFAPAQMRTMDRTVQISDPWQMDKPELWPGQKRAKIAMSHHSDITNRWVPRTPESHVYVVGKFDHRSTPRGLHRVMPASGLLVEGPKEAWNMIKEARGSLYAIRLPFFCDAANREALLATPKISDFWQWADQYMSITRAEQATQLMIERGTKDSYFVDRMAHSLELAIKAYRNMEKSYGMEEAELQVAAPMWLIRRKAWKAFQTSRNVIFGCKQVVQGERRICVSDAKNERRLIASVDLYQQDGTVSTYSDTFHKRAGRTRKMGMQRHDD